MKKDLSIASSADLHRRMRESRLVNAHNPQEPFLEGHVLRGRGVVAGCFRRLPVATYVAIALGIEKLDFVGVDKVPIVLASGLFVVLGLGALAAFEVDATAFMEVSR